MKTYRYLRLAMVAMVLGLAVAVVHEVLRVDGNCWQTSLSGYYYTPVQNLFVGALIAIGVCLVSLKGNTDSEDVLLNFAGMCAPFVALVPIHDPSACGVVTDDLNRDLNIANNVVALLAVIGAALAALAVLWWHNRRTPNGEPAPTRIEILGYAESVLLFGAAVAVFRLQPEWFDRYGHPVAAIAMFVFVFANVVVNAVNIYYERRGTDAPVRRLNRYTWIALAMVASVVGSVLLGAAGVQHWLLLIEASLIGCFAVFWGFQTWELWDQGLRKEPGATSISTR
ncbi:hypothetical protein [Blastococcus goldschmidtiae]|uniref:Uncharacterized protein n=1 Tax=Blastococcus goldschmidtiae TaxID=3075546 RepID=A0ABU2K1R8_9ACTN|nr:hypothetical protein [Blastococcus sp. DSM 46792]MDT0274288.1 hypothetical protein [Blastococcus sp. DSM 46792]